MENYIFLFNEWWYVLILAGIMLSTGIIKQYGLFVPFYNFLIRRVKNKKILVVLLSLFGGILPVPGRVIISAGLLDTIAPDDPKKRAKFGIIDYLATHHYYLWSPLEKTVIIPMAVLKLSYLGVLSYTWPLLLVSILFLIWYIWTLKSEDVEVKSIPKKEDKEKNWFSFIDWKNILLILIVIIIGNLIKHDCGSIKVYVEQLAHSISTGTFMFLGISVLAFISSFVMGSSSKFAGTTALLTSIFGLKYFTYLFAIEFAGYLLSPVHKCVAIGMTYFKTPIKTYYKVLTIWSIILIITGILAVIFSH